MSVAEDVKTCHDATYGVGTNVGRLASVLCSRSRAHLKEVAAAFEAEHGKALRSVVEKECSGNVEQILTAALREPSDTRALILHRCVQGAGTNEGGLIDCILPLTPDEMKQLNDTWTTRFGLPIMARIMVDGVLMGPFHYLLEQQTCGNKPGGGVNQDAVVGDCKLLVGAGEGKLGTEEKAIAELFSTRSQAHLQFLEEEYKKHSPKQQSLSAAIKDEIGGALQQALICSLTEPNEYFADRLAAAMKGLGSRKDDLTNAVLLTPDLKKTVAAYKHKYGDLLADIKKETRGDLEDCLVAYLEFNLNN